MCRIAIFTSALVFAGYLSAAQAGQRGGAPGAVGQQGGAPGAAGQQGGTPAQQGGVGQIQGGTPAQKGSVGQAQGGTPAQQGGVGQPQGGTAAQKGSVGQTQGGTVAQQGPGYFGYTQKPWFTSPGIQQQLNLNNEQMNQLNKAYGEGWNTYSKGISGLGNINEQERFQKLQGLNSTFTGQLNQAAQGTLSPQQMQRFQQLNLQYQGMNAFADPAIQQKLNLAPDQMQKIQALNAEQAKTLLTIQQQAATDPTAAANQYQQFRTQNNQQLNSILNEQQRQAWSQMVGDPYTFTPDWLQSSKK